LGYATLFLWSFLAATILPLGSEPSLVAVVLRGHDIAVAIAVATVGNVLGSLTTYWLARRAAEIMEQRGSIAHIDESRAGRILRRYGQPALLLSWVPLIGDAIVAAAGAVKTPLVPFTVWVAVGKAARYAAVAYTAAAMR
jgi:membrane protein YqaA with SNARE-associated domain